MTRPLLIAGVGNLFLGDDAFGCEVVRRLRQSQPELDVTVELRDFGVDMRGLSYALARQSAVCTDRVAVIVDAVCAKAEAGALQLFGLHDPRSRKQQWLEGIHHAQDVDDALEGARALGARLEDAYLLGCEPMSFEPAPDPSTAVSCLLSPPVEAAAQRAVYLLGRLIAQPQRDLLALCRELLPALPTGGECANAQAE